MKKITYFVSKPSQIVRAMINGLYKQSKRENFQIDMRTFGANRRKMLAAYHDYSMPKRKTCFGCAATCALQEITGIMLTQDEISYTLYRERAAGLDGTRRFEQAVDYLRRGNLLGFYEYCKDHFGVFPPAYPEILTTLSTQAWPYNIWQYEKYAEWLEGQGL